MKAILFHITREMANAIFQSFHQDIRSNIPFVTSADAGCSGERTASPELGARGQAVSNQRLSASGACVGTGVFFLVTGACVSSSSWNMAEAFWIS